MGAWGGDDFVLSFVYPLLSAVFFEIRPAPLVFWLGRRSKHNMFTIVPIGTYRTIRVRSQLRISGDFTSELVAQQAPNNFCAF